eukprot:m.116738 g.116738  ORF g.116738 m.116738 type:complete len:239 (-) comp12861_c2_seq2:354-1070(-)
MSSVWESRRGNTPNALADQLLKSKGKNKKLRKKMEKIKQQQENEQAKELKRIERHSVALQTPSSFVQKESTHRHEVEALQKRIERMISLQEVATRKYDRQQKAYQRTLDENRDLSVAVATLQQKLEHAESKIKDLKKQVRGSKIPQKRNQTVTIRNPSDFAEWMKERDHHIAKLAALERENEILRGGLKLSNQRYDHLKGQVSQMSPAFFQELEDLKFQLHHEKVKSRALEHRIEHLH